MREDSSPRAPRRFLGERRKNWGTINRGDAGKVGGVYRVDPATPRPERLDALSNKFLDPPGERTHYLTRQRPWPHFWVWVNVNIWPTAR